MTNEEMQELIRQYLSWQKQNKVPDERTKSAIQKLMKMTDEARTNILKDVEAERLKVLKRHHTAIDFGKDEDMLKELARFLSKKPKK